MSIHALKTVLKLHTEYAFSISIAVALLTVAFAHKLQMNDFDTYRHSILIPVEFFLLLVSLFGLVVVFCSGVVGVFKRQWLRALIGALSCIAIYSLIALSMFIDATTLIFMT